VLILYSVVNETTKPETAFGIANSVFSIYRFLPARRYASAVLPSSCVRLYVHPSVCHKSVFY